MVDAPLGALEILYVVAQEHDDVVIWGASLCIRYVKQLAEQILGDAERHFGLVFHMFRSFLLDGVYFLNAVVAI